MTTLRVWAPNADGVEACVGSGDSQTRRQMNRADGGWWRVNVTAHPPFDYGFSLDGAEPLPDPRSPRQPGGVHGLSRSVDHESFAWQAKTWRGIPLPGSVAYELHIGTFTPEGTFDAAVGRLDHLAALGVDVVEVMPVATFPGDRGWGYDGVFPYAVQESYGGPEAFKRFVDGCHLRGMGVILDVVYNHLGPDGNVLAQYGPYFTDRYSTLWGAAVNYDGAGCDEVRRYVVDNALMWLRDYRVDGLRLDAVHAIFDTSATHILEQVAGEVAALGASTGRFVFVVAESDAGNPRLVTSRDAGGYGVDAQWSDDFHHAVHAAFTAERSGYYADFGPLSAIAKSLRHGYVYDGQYSRYRGHHHGRPLPPAISGHRLFGYVQDHDQVGNRARGERLTSLASPGLARVAAALLLTSPFTPLLFMGEEWGATTPWQYFTDHRDPHLAQAVRDGRRAEFTSFGWAPDQVPDPQDPATFERSRLNWAQLDDEAHAAILTWYRSLIALRRNRPALRDGNLAAVDARCDDDALWLTARRGDTVVVANVAPRRQRVPLTHPVKRILLSSARGFAFGPDGIELDGESVVVASC